MRLTPTTAKINDVAQYLLVRYQSDGVPVAPVKLQKVLYYIQAWHLVYFDGHPLFNDEPEAWVNGPVYPAVFPLYKGTMMHQPIVVHQPLVAPKSKPAVDAENRARVLHEALGLTEQQAQVVENIYQAYGFLDDQRLVLMTHSEKPWLEARKGLLPLAKGDKPISHESMRACYSARIGRTK